MSTEYLVIQKNYNMNLKNYIKYISLVGIFSVLITSVYSVNGQVVSGNSVVTTLQDNSKTIAVPNCDYGTNNTTGTYKKNVVGFIIGKTVSFNCKDGTKADFLNVSFQTGTGEKYQSSTGYINSKNVKVTAVPNPSPNVASAALTLQAINPIIKPSCIPKTSNNAGAIAKGAIGSVLNKNVTFICPDKSILDLAFVRFPAGAGGNKNQVEGYVMKTEIKINDFDAAQKSNLMAVNPTKNTDLYRKVACPSTKKTDPNAFASVSPLSLGVVVGTAYKIKCGTIFETFYKVGFPRDVSLQDSEYFEGYINAKNVKLTPIGIKK
jgi:hypothetical protein